MTENIFVDKVRMNLIEMQPIFGLTNGDFLKAIQIAEKIGWVQAKPSSIALAIIRIIKPKLTNKEIYKKGKTEYFTVRHWTEFVCIKLNKKNTFF